VDRLRSSAPPPCALRVVACPVPGLSAARNAAIAEARGDVICFLDDDASAADTWLETIVRAFASHPDAGVVGGHIVLTAPDPRPEVLERGWEKHWSQYITEFQTFTTLDDWQQFPWGASWSARRQALREIGGFRTQYGRRGEDFWGGEELVAACLIRRLGYRVAVAPDALVHHDVHRARFTLEHVRRTMRAGYLVGYAARRDQYLPGSDRGVGHALKQLVTDHTDPALRHSPYRWRDLLYRKQAQVRVLGTAIADLGRRARRPIVAGR
jgi:GT2 family glycosyltransferase